MNQGKLLFSSDRSEVGFQGVCLIEIGNVSNSFLRGIYHFENFQVCRIDITFFQYCAPEPVDPSLPVIANDQYDGKIN